MNFTRAAIAGLFLSFSSHSHAACCEHQTPEQTRQNAHAIGEFHVADVDSYRDATGRIRTTCQLTLNAPLKNQPPAVLEWDLPGGVLGEEEESSSLNPGWKPGEDHILYLQQHPDGQWSPLPFRSLRCPHDPAARKALRNAVQGTGDGPMLTASIEEDAAQGASGVPSSRVTPTGYFESSGVPSRFITCDSGASIPCIVDIDPAKLPTGVTQDGALQIVRNALAAWSNASSARFIITGTTSFGVGADTIAQNDGTLRIQLHDTYNRISSNSVLGIGGGSWGIDPGAGATIAGRTFNRRNYGYVVTNHRPASMADATKFAEVLTHEIGHALGLVHSSEQSTESDPILKNATMFYMLSGDGRGASIKLYDEDRIAYGYPLNTPPAAFDRILRVVTGSPQPTGPGVDRVTLTPFDLQTPGNLTVTPVGSLPTGFTLNGTTLSYACPAYGDAQLSDQQIEQGYSYGIAWFQVSDGVNLSAKHKLVITGYHRDTQPADGLPDSWLSTYFGTITPGAAGSPRHQNSDPDGDGLTNRIERYLGTNPIDRASGLPKMTYHPSTHTLSFTPLRFAPHIIQSSSNCLSWTARQPVGTFSPPAVRMIDMQQDALAARMFYRLSVTP